MDFTKQHRTRTGWQLLGDWLLDLVQAIALGLLLMSPLIFDSLNRHFGWGLN